MPPRSVVVLSLLVPMLLSSGACARRRAADTASAPAAETSLRGTVSVTGTSAAKRLVLRVGERSVSLTGSTADSASLTRLGGVEVEVRGRTDASVFRVGSFTAQRVDGQPVVDGFLRRDGDRLVLETANGRTALGNPPAAFRSMVGARVWVGGPLDTGPNVYGIIVPAPDK